MLPDRSRVPQGVAGNRQQRGSCDAALPGRQTQLQEPSRRILASAEAERAHGRPIVSMSTKHVVPVASLIVAAVLALVLLGSGLRHAPVSPPVDQARSKDDSPEPPASKEYTKQRHDMVTWTMEQPRDGRTPIKDKAVLAAMRAVPRHVFVPESLRRRAYADSPLPIGHGQTISQPYIVALMTELLQLTPGSKVLEIGSGSGYQAAVLAHLTQHVYTVEIIKPLAQRAQAALREQGYNQIHCRQADGYFGWKEEAPFDAIIVTCAAGHLPPPLWEQLKPGGRIVIPIGGPYEVQRLVLVTKTDEGKRRSRTIISVRFVPLTRGVDRDNEADAQEKRTP